MKKFLVLALIVVSCQYNPQEINSKFIQNNQINYASGFALETSENITKVEVYNPWANNAVLSRYVFTKDKTYSPVVGEVVVHVPIKSGVFLSSTYLGMLAMLDAREVVAGCTNPNWIYDSLLYKRFLDGKIKHLGSDIQVTAEKVIGAKPEIVMKYIFQGADPADKMINEVGIPIVYNIEFMENSPLGRAEWIKLVGAMLDKTALSDSLFEEIEMKYLALKNLAKKSESIPSVIDGSSFKGTWYAAGGRSFVAQLINDANASYYWSTDTTIGSLPLSFEVVLQKQGEADYWINCNAAAFTEILAVEPRCELLSSYRNSNVYHFNKRVNPEGGFDYYETGVIRPDLVLHDLLVILHPELLSETEETYFYKRLD